MKKVLLVALAFIGLQVAAQEHKGENRRHHNKMMTNLSAEEIATLKTKKMTLLLDLNEAQQNKILEINLEKATKRKAMVANRKAQKENGSAQKPTEKERYAREIAKLDRMIAEKAQMKTILNKTQYEKWEQAKMRMAFHGKHKKQGSKKI